MSIQARITVLVQNGVNTPELQTFERTYPNMAALIAAEFTAQQQITELDLSNNLENLSYNDISLLASQLMANNTIETLALDNCALQYSSTEYHAISLIGSILKTNQSITTLRLCQNKISTGGIEWITKALTQNRSLKTLILNENEIGNQGAIYIANVLTTHPSLINVSLGTNHLGSNLPSPWELVDRASPAIIAALQTNIMMETCDLHDHCGNFNDWDNHWNHISIENYHQIDALIARNQHIKPLVDSIKAALEAAIIACNGDDANTILLKYQELRAVIALAQANADFPDKNNLVQPIHHTYVLMELRIKELMQPKIIEKTIAAIRDGAESVDFSQLGLTDKHIEEISTILKTDTVKLKRLILSDNIITTIGVRHIMMALACHKTLETVELDWYQPGNGSKKIVLQRDIGSSSQDNATKNTDDVWLYNFRVSSPQQLDSKMRLNGNDREILKQLCHK